MDRTPIVGFRFARTMKVSELAAITRAAAMDRSLTLKDAADVYGKMAVVEQIKIRSVANV